MNPADPSPADLADYLESIRKDGAAGCGPSNATVRCNPAACNGYRLAEIREVIGRPPTGMVIFKYGSRSLVGGYSLSDGTGVVLKYYYPRGIHKHLGYGIKGSRCMRSWRAAMAFAYVGLATPPAIMIAEWRAMGGLWLEKSALVTGQAEGVTLSSWCESHGGDAKRMASLAERLRDQFSKMARYRISHGDLKQSNIIIGPDDSLMFVDLDAVSFHSSKSEWEAGRSRDIKIFNANWTSNSPAATAFAEIFS